MVGEGNYLYDVHKLTLLDAISAASIHPLGTAIATCSGQRLPENEQKRREHVIDNSVKVWNLSQDGADPLPEREDPSSYHTSAE